MRGVLFILAWLAALPASAEPPQRPDVAAMVNGDIHHGSLGADPLRLKTPYGEVALPLASLATFRAVKGGARVETVEGERFSGTLLHDRLPFLRVGQPRLDLHAADLAEIVFMARPEELAGRPAPDLVEMRNGDRFRARLPALAAPSQVIHVEVEGKARAFVHSAAGFEEMALAQPSLRAELRWRIGIDLPWTGIAALAFGRLPAEAPNLGPLPLGLHRPVAPPQVERDRLRDGSLGPEMVFLPGGIYMRGDLQGDGDFDEKPARPITLKPFAIAAHPVSFEDYDRYCEAAAKPKPDDRGWGRGAQPAVNVSWDEAMDYIRWLSDQTGRRYRLPTDAEREYAARGGTASRFWWGDAPRPGMALCGGCGTPWDGERPVRSGRFPPNGYGLYDMAGNIWEWVADCWNNSFADAPSDGAALDKGECNKRVFRGGAWSTVVQELRSANRWREFPQRHGDDTGFRLARDAGR
ncbi:MAG: formylglycine-generating enzyme family protein [Magnetospirillum sp. WYHS-4]